MFFKEIDSIQMRLKEYFQHILLPKSVSFEKGVDWSLKDSNMIFSKNLKLKLNYRVYCGLSKNI